MAYDHEEQEQLATLKSVWKQYGNAVTWVVIILLGAYAAWVQWGNYQSGQSAQASQLYDEVQKSVAAKDNAKVQRVSADLKEKFATTAYAPMAALVAAKNAFDVGDLKAAKAQLQWVVDAGKNDNYRSLAKIRLAGILLDEKSYDEAQKQLSGDFPAELQPELADRQGDIYVALNKIDDAKKSYQLALDKMTEKSPGRQLVQIKLDAIGGANASPVAK